MEKRYNSIGEILNSDLFNEITAQPKLKKSNIYDPEVEGFLEIVHFFKETGRVPQKTMEWSERQLASRLIGIKKKPERMNKLKKYDDVDLLESKKTERKVKSIDDILNFGLSDLLDDEIEASVNYDIFNTSRYREIENKPDYVAKRKALRDFSGYENIFKNVQREISEGIRNVVPFKNYDIKQGSFFIQKGILLYIESVGEFFKNENGEDNARLHVVYENGTESNVLLRSLAASLYKTGSSGKMITDNIENVVSSIAEDDISSGYIYILKSLSTNKDIASIKELYKVGVTKGSVKKRISNAINESTYLYAPVEIVSTYNVYNLDAGKFEKTIHKVLGNHKLDVEIIGANGRMILPREWFVISLTQLDEVINKIIVELVNSD